MDKCQKDDLNTANKDASIPYNSSSTELAVRLESESYSNTAKGIEIPHQDETKRGLVCRESTVTTVQDVALGQNTILWHVHHCRLYKTISFLMNHITVCHLFLIFGWFEHFVKEKARQTTFAVPIFADTVSSFFVAMKMTHFGQA